MVANCPAPVRPLTGGVDWLWHSLDSLDFPNDDSQGPWVRIWHHGPRTPSGHYRRTYGPFSRFDHHEPDPAGNAQESPSGRSILYVARTLRGALVEVFGDLPAAAICSNYRLSLLMPVAVHQAQDLRSNGCMAIGALPGLCTAALPRQETQACGQAIYEDRPAGPDTSGIVYPGAHDFSSCQAVFDSSPPIELVSGTSMPPAGVSLTRIRGRVQKELRAAGIRAEWISRAACKTC